MKIFLNIIYTVFICLFILKHDFVNLQRSRHSLKPHEPIISSPNYFDAYEKRRIFPGKLKQRDKIQSANGTLLYNEIFILRNGNKYGESIDFVPDKILKDGSKIINNKQTTERLEDQKEHKFVGNKIIISIESVSNDNEKRFNILRKAIQRIETISVDTKDYEINIDIFSKLDKHCNFEKFPNPKHPFFMFNSNLTGEVCSKLLNAEAKDPFKNFTYINNNKTTQAPLKTSYFGHIHRKNMTKIGN